MHRLLALAASCLLILCGTVASASANSRPPAAQRQIVVASYNIHHGATAGNVLDLESIATELEATGASVIGLQEVDNHWGERSAFVDQAAWLAERLGMQYCYGANLDLPPLEGATANRQYGTAILSSHPIRECHNTLLPNHPGGEQRGLLQARLKVRGVDVTFMNTHLTHNNAAGRLAQSQAVNQVIAGTSTPVVLVGDFNATPSSPEYASFVAEVDDVWAAVGQGPGFTYPVEAPDRRIDYVFASASIVPIDMQVLPTDASDHLPVTATLVLPHPSGK